MRGILVYRYWNNCGRMLRRGDLPAALEGYRELAHMCDESRVEAHREMGAMAQVKIAEILHNLGDEEGAAKARETAMSVFGELHRMHKLLNHELYVECCLQHLRALCVTGDYPCARDLYGRVVLLAKDDPETRCMAACMMADAAGAEGRVTDLRLYCGVAVDQAEIAVEDGTPRSRGMRELAYANCIDSMTAMGDFMGVSMLEARRDLGRPAGA